MLAAIFDARVLSTVRTTECVWYIGCRGVCWEHVLPVLLGGGRSCAVGLPVGAWCCGIIVGGL